MKSRSWTTCGVIAVSLLLAVAQLHHFLLFSSASLEANVDAAIGITTGHPHWRVYQNRVLGPFMLKGLTRLVSGNDKDAYLLLALASFCLSGYLAWRLGKRIGGNQTGWFALVLLHLMFVFLRSNFPFLYVWDFVGLIVFLTFVDFVIGEKHWRWFAALFAVAILSRESGLFIALWMILEPASRWLLRSPRSLPTLSALSMMVAGVSCAIVGVWLVNYLRTTLLVREIGLFNFRVPKGYGPNVFWCLSSNLSFVSHARQAGLTVILTVAKAAFIFSSLVGVALALVLRNAAGYLALSMTMLAFAVSLLLFAEISETRVFIETIPFLLLGACLLHRSAGLGEAVTVSSQ